MSLFVFWGVAIYLAIDYMRYREVMEDLQKSADVLYADLTEFENVYWDALPENKKDVEKVIKWGSAIFDEEYRGKFRERGFDVLFDSIERRSIVYSYGYDGEDGALRRTPYNYKRTTDSGNETGIRTPDFWEYLKDRFGTGENTDVILLEVSDVDKTRGCTGILEERLGKRPFLQLFKESKNLVETGEEQRFLDFVKRFSKEYWKRYSIPVEEQQNVKTLRVLFKYNKGGVQNLCPNGIGEEQIKDLESLLSARFVKENADYFDFAVFSFQVPDETTLNND
ncbi:hypothetical protein DN748_00425 [Sinomicrobium soli]|nr:hypothetical protein DN748_00425 [Sinomicrobium sp. N-1-3-6]